MARKWLPPAWKFGALITLLIVALVWTALVILQPLPARRIVMATGSRGNAYYADGMRYRANLARHGVDVVILATNGSIENLKRLNDPKGGVDAGFVQGGTTNEDESPHLTSLGTVGYSPLWVFCRGVPQGLELTPLPGPRLSIGPEGSGTRLLALQVLHASGIDAAGLDPKGYPPELAAEKLEAGEIDVAFIMTGWESPVVRRLLARPNIGLINFSRADAYITMQPSLNKVVVPAGVGSLAANQPPRDVTLIAPKTSLVVRKDLHPALQYLLQQAAIELHSGPGAFHRSGQFPAPEVIDLPISDETRHLYQAGPSLLQQYLPFWAAELVHRLLAVGIPLAGIVYPIILILTRFYNWQIEWRISRLYGELRQLEAELRTAPPQARAALIARLVVLERRTSNVKVPKRSTQLIYTLQSHIVLVRESLHSPSARPPTDESAPEAAPGSG